jgi:hypothetical protein
VGGESRPDPALCQWHHRSPRSSGGGAGGGGGVISACALASPSTERGMARSALGRGRPSSSPAPCRPLPRRKRLCPPALPYAPGRHRAPCPLPSGDRRSGHRPRPSRRSPSGGGGSAALALPLGRPGHSVGAAPSWGLIARRLDDGASPPGGRASPALGGHTAVGVYHPLPTCPCRATICWEVTALVGGPVVVGSATTRHRGPRSSAGASARLCESYCTPSSAASTVCPRPATGSVVSEISCLVGLHAGSC